MSSLRRLISEIHHRSLWQVVLIYVGAAWACFELIETVTERLGLPVWLPGLAIVLFLLALPVVLATAFVREDGLATPPAEGAEAEAITAHHEARRKHRALTWRNAGLGFMGVLAVWGVVAAGWFFTVGVEYREDQVFLSTMREIQQLAAAGAWEEAYERAKGVQGSVAGYEGRSRSCPCRGLRQLHRLVAPGTHTAA